MSELVAEIERTLDGAIDPRERVLSWVRLLDLAVAREPDTSSAARVALTSAMVAAGRALLDAGVLELDTNVRATVAAAERYLEHPDEACWTAYEEAATASYPFGSGDGCFAIAELASSCAAGSGCRSGAGALYFVAQAIGEARLVDAVGPALAERCARARAARTLLR
ncbi:hypothetical protein [Sandaracinus amylolyticus]|uniref:Uncharacterized protein n=1 Tax=Sandaracinus amylolyticus TaxID=927083 RepID=A0A0F6WAM8_9BACT|nr:hypothetical protein [Sandaracinus amylolyticus]AKF11681.1 hypothetical protein DB32_008830 [Sandaracinus amylolyticus]